MKMHSTLWVINIPRERNERKSKIAVNLVYLVGNFSLLKTFAPHLLYHIYKQGKHSACVNCDSCLFSLVLSSRWFHQGPNPYTNSPDWLFSTAYWNRDYSQVPDIYWDDLHYLQANWSTWDVWMINLVS